MHIRNNVLKELVNEGLVTGQEAKTLPMIGELKSAFRRASDDIYRKMQETWAEQKRLARSDEPFTEQDAQRKTAIMALNRDADALSVLHDHFRDCRDNLNAHNASPTINSEAGAAIRRRYRQELIRLIAFRRHGEAAQNAMLETTYGKVPYIHHIVPYLPEGATTGFSHPEQPRIAA